MGLIKALFGHAPGDILLIFGGLDQELLTKFLAVGEGRVLWLSPDGSDRLADDPGFAAATRANRLLFLTGQPAGTIPALGSQLSGRPVTAVLADRGGELSSRPDLVRDLPARIFALTGAMPRVVMTARRENGGRERLQRLLGALPEASLKPVPDDGTGSWLFAGDLPAGVTAEAVPVPPDTCPDQDFPQPYGTLQSLDSARLHRYAFARHFCGGLAVLDAAMDCGYGSLLLNAGRYTGIDPDAAKVAFANRYYKPLAPNATYLQDDLDTLPADTGTIDTLLSFETLERLEPGSVAGYFAEARRVLTPNGTLVCMVPAGADARRLLAGQGFDVQSLWSQEGPHYPVLPVVGGLAGDRGGALQASQPTIAVAHPVSGKPVIRGQGAITRATPLQTTGTHSAVNVCFCDGGLSNRLNALLFALILRHRYGHDWEIAWPRNNWCGAAFDSLFETDLPVNERTLSDFKQHESDYYFLVHENQGDFDASRIAFNRDITGYDGYRAQLGAHAGIFYTHHLLPGFVGLEDLGPALAQLRVNRDVATKALTFCRERQIDEMVLGLHIRKTDFGDKVDDNGLFNLVSQNPNRFFVCSDSAEVTERFGALPNCEVFEKQYYPEKLTGDAGWNSFIVDSEGRQFPYNISRSGESIVEALVDLLILSRTTLVATSHSTFFTMASFFKAFGYLAQQEERLNKKG